LERVHPIDRRLAAQALGRGYVYGKLSPDGKWAAVHKFTDKGNAIALVRLARATNG